MRLLSAALGTLLLTLSSLTTAADTTLEPSVQHSPQDVVAIVIDALQNNNTDDAGIATVFRFASPANRSYTGPLERFTQMIKYGFSDMLNHATSEFDEMDIQGVVAVQAVWLSTANGDEIGYAFQLGKQADGDYANMWMTDAVIPLGRRPSTGQSI